jgi:hypothetical protein
MYLKQYFNKLVMYLMLLKLIFRFSTALKRFFGSECQRFAFLYTKTFRVLRVY